MISPLAAAIEFSGSLAATASGIAPKVGAFSGIRIPAHRQPRLPKPLGRLGSLEIRLASKATEVRCAQRLRYSVFYKEMFATPGAINMLAQRDIDVFDAVSDHLLVFDNSLARNPFWPSARAVGTYRLLRQDIAQANTGFYTAHEFKVNELLRRHQGLNFLELGRSCVLPSYRTKRTIELLWHGIWSYVMQHDIDVLIGCASFHTTNPDEIAPQLAFLHHYASAPEEWRVQAQTHRYVEMNRRSKSQLDTKAALRGMPPLIKGYLRLGGMVGRGAVIDRQFRTADVFIVLPVANISSRYIEHFGPVAERHAA